MSKIDEIRAEMMKAMKNKEKDRKETLSMLLAALKNKAIDKRAEEMSEEAIRAVIKEVMEALGIMEPSAKDKGKIMKELMPRVKGKADGSLVNKLVGEILA